MLVDDDLDKFRKQFEADKKAADDARARNEADREREKAYDMAWQHRRQVRDKFFKTRHLDCIPGHLLISFTHWIRDEREYCGSK
jgi:hypothetical protein